MQLPGLPCMVREKLSICVDDVRRKCHVTCLENIMAMMLRGGGGGGGGGRALTS